MIIGQDHDDAKPLSVRNTDHVKYMSTRISAEERADLGTGLGNGRYRDRIQCNSERKVIDRDHG